MPLPGLPRRRLGAALVPMLAAAGLTVTGLGLAQTAQAAPSGQIVYALDPLSTINWYLPLIPDAYDSVANALASSLLYLPLFDFNVYLKINYSDSAASALHWNANGTQYVVRLNPKWHWSNGDPVTANDVAFTWELLQYACSPAVTAPWPFSGCGAGGMPAIIKDLHVDNPHQFTVTLTQPANQLFFLLNGLDDLTPMPSKAWNLYPGNPAKELAYLTSQASNPAFFKVVDGPFAFQAAIPNVSWSFVPNPKYDGAKPSYGRLVLAFEASDQAEFDALRTGQVDVGYLPADMYGSKSQLRGFGIVPSYPFGINRIALNYQAPGVGSLFQNLYLRQAMQMAIPQESLIKYAFHGYATPGVTFVPEMPPTPFLAPQAKNPVYPYNPAKGRALLEAHGWHLVNGVMTNAAGQQLSFTAEYPAGSQTEENEAVLIQAGWAQEGIQVSLRPLPYPELLAQHHQPTTWQIQMEMPFTYGASYPNAAGQLGTGGGFNFYGYSDPTMDRLIQATEVPYPTQRQLYGALYRSQLYAAQQLPTLYLPFPATLNVVSDRLTHIIQYGPGGVVLGLTPMQDWAIRH